MPHSWTGEHVQRHARGCLVCTGTSYAHQLLAATLALKIFLKGTSGILILFQLDNAIAVAYINNMGGTVLCQLTGLAKELWMWALDRDIALSTQHIPGVSNTIADIGSQTGQTGCSTHAYFKLLRKPLGHYVDLLYLPPN